jgi:cytochrome P450
MMRASAATTNEILSATTTSTSEKEEEENSKGEEKEGAACPYSSVKSFLGMDTKKETIADLRREYNQAEPAVIDDISFLKSLVKAARHPVGMPIAMLDWAEQKGECVGIQNAIGPDCVSILDPEIVEYVCHTNAKNYKLRMLPDAFRFVIKNKGITGSDGQYNREHRLMCQKPFINSFSLTQFSNTVEERINYMCETWRTACGQAGEGKINVNIDNDSQMVTLDVIGKVAFAFDFEQCESHAAKLLRGEDIVKDNISQILDSYNGTSEIMGQLFITPGPILKLQYALGIGRVRELKEKYAILESVGTKLINERRETVKQRVADGDFNDYCLLDVLVKAKDEDGNLLPDEDLWGDINDVMAAGHRTTASNFTVNLFHVARNPEIQRKIEEEVAKLGGRAPTFEDVQEGRLDYTRMVVKESLRKYAPINLFPRLASGEDTLPSGHKVKAGDFILLSSYAMGRNPRVWENPLEFNPDRFTDESLRSQAEKQATASARDDPEKLEIARERMRRRMTAGRDFTYTPFGAGPRSCIGGVFALLTATTMLATAVQNFKFGKCDDGKHKDPGDEIPIMYDTTICFPEGVWLSMTPREPKLGLDLLSKTSSSSSATTTATTTTIKREEGIPTAR